MRRYIITLCAAVVASQLLYPNLFPERQRVSPQKIAYENHQQQTMQPVGGLDANSIFQVGPPPTGPTLADMIGIDQTCTIISDYTLGLEEVARRLMDPEQKTLVLAPINSAIQLMSRKPWDDAGSKHSDGIKIEPQRNEDKASQNLERFVKSHIIPEFPIKEGSKTTNMAGDKIWYTMDKATGRKMIQPGNFEVISEKSESNGNGAIWVIRGVIE